MQAPERLIEQLCGHTPSAVGRQSAPLATPQAIVAAVVRFTRTRAQPAGIAASSAAVSRLRLNHTGSTP
jgi:hypothetical protein